MANVSEILDSINGNVLTGGRRTKASGVRETLALIAESYLNKEDDANVAGGYLKISDTEIVDVSFIKKTSPTGQFLKDDGTWADAESLNTNTVFLSNDDTSYNSGWADGDTLLAEKNTIYYLQNASPGETLNISIDETDVPVGSMVAFTDGQAAGNGIQGNVVISGAIPSSGGDNQVYSGETVIFRYDGFDWRLMMRYSRNLISQSIASGATRFAPSSDAVFTALAGKVDTTRTLTINGVTQNLSANRTWTIDALPSQSGNSGKFLTTNGTVASWALLTSTNITDALTYTPANKAGDTLSGFLTLHADPTNSMHAVTKNYVDNLLTGLTWKEKVRVATTANITLSGTQTIDGVSVIASDRVLVKNQTTQTENGIYIVSASTWTRSNDANTGAEILTAAVLVTAGTTQANTQWTCSNSTTPTVGSTNITFAQIAGAGVYTNGTGISLSGNAFSLDLTRVATSSVTGLLSASDWTTFNGKFNTPTGLTTNFVNKWNGSSFVDSLILSRTGGLTLQNSTVIDLNTESKSYFEFYPVLKNTVGVSRFALDIFPSSDVFYPSFVGIIGIKSGGDVQNSKNTLRTAITITHRSTDSNSGNQNAILIDAQMVRPTISAVTKNGTGVHHITSVNADNYSSIIQAGSSGLNPINYSAYSQRSNSIGFQHVKEVSASSGIQIRHNFNQLSTTQTTWSNGFGFDIKNVLANNNASPQIVSLTEEYVIQNQGAGTVYAGKRYRHENINQGSASAYIIGLYRTGVIIGDTTAVPNAATQLDLVDTTKGAGLNLVTTANLPSFSTRRGNLAFDDTLKTPVISLDRASNATSSWFEIATANRATKAATAADGGAITNWSGNTDYFYTTTVTGAKLGQNVVVNFDATLGALINGTNTVVNSYVSATNTVIIWVRTGTYVPATTLSGNFLISVI